MEKFRHPERRIFGIGTHPLLIDFKKLFLILILVYAGSAKSQVSEIPGSREEKTIPGMAKGLKEIRFYKNDYKVVIQGDEYFGTKLISEYETEKLGDLQDFGFVQFIVGSQYETVQNPGGTIEIFYNVLRHFFGETIVFNHPHWVIDSVDTDPIYNSVAEDPSLPRHALYRWNSKPGSHDKPTEKYFKDAFPERPVLYVRDLPGVTSFSSYRRAAHNIDLKFKTCLYRTAEVPLTVKSPSDVDFAAPLGCFEWKSRFLYNHQTDQFESPQSP